MDSVQHSMMEMTATFNKKMAEFQRDLQNISSNNSQPASNSPTSKLAAEFNAFQSFVLSSLKTLQTQITFLSNQYNKLEMRSRRKILLIHGVPEDSKEFPSKLAIKILTDHLKNLDLTEDAISRCHRLGVSKKDKPRPIVIKFKDAVMRNSICNKSRLIELALASCLYRRKNKQGAIKSDVNNFPQTTERIVKSVDRTSLYPIGAEKSQDAAIGQQIIVIAGRSTGPLRAIPSVDDDLDARNIGRKRNDKPREQIGCHSNGTRARG
ncbi:unnamed protein product [Colias eurytheme]|nr:unnamed protein product [Colias eurytheme]